MHVFQETDFFWIVRSGPGKYFAFLLVLRIQFSWVVFVYKQKRRGWSKYKIP